MSQYKRFSIKNLVLNLLEGLSLNSSISSFILWFFKPIIALHYFHFNNSIFEIANEVQISNFLKAKLNRRQVLSGPFEGLQFPPVPRFLASYNFAALVLGTYEKEIHPWFDRILSSGVRFEKVINIGSGCGYYVLGLAQKGVAQQVIAVDKSDSANRYLLEGVKLNQLEDEVEVYTSLQQLKEEDLSKGRNLWIIDCEGCEKDVLLESNINFSNSDLIVETHEFIHFNIVKDIIERFNDTHEVENVGSVPDMKKVEDYRLDVLENESKPDKFKLLAESRNVEMTWLYLKSKMKKDA